MIIAIGLALAILSCKGSARDQSAGGPQGTPTPPANADAQALADVKALLFADQPLEQLVNMIEPAETPKPNDPVSLFTASVAASGKNNTDDARKYLHQVLGLPENESRIQLWAWNGLRKLGERPPADVGDKVQGVVCELHNEAGVGTLAAYADGRARWIGGKGAAIVWEVPGDDAAIDNQIRKLLKAAEPLVKTAPLSDTHQTDEPKMEYFRVSILTFNGVRVVEAYGPTIEQSQPIGVVLVNSVNLLDMLTKKSEEMEKKQKPTLR
jgi:hypothetical protein